MKNSRLLSAAAVLLLATAVSVSAAGTASADVSASPETCGSAPSTTCLHLVKPGQTQWPVPNGVTSITVDLYGAQGGGDNGGKGGHTKATLAVTPGQNLQITVGGKGEPGGSDGPSAGYNGGGAAADWVRTRGNGGGGPSDIRTADSKGEYPLDHRTAVAGGGGGDGSVIAGVSYSGGSGGGLTGESGSAAAGGIRATGGGPERGGTGAKQGRDCIGANGSEGKGGDAYSSSYCYGGGGGGGGYFGGGGGTGGYGGGGGSSYANDVKASYEQGTQAGDGKVDITFAKPCGDSTSMACVGWLQPGVIVWTVPAGVASITVELFGAQGGTGAQGGKGGKGGRTKATLAVTPGEKLQITVGGQGRLGGDGRSGGSNGGGESADWGSPHHAGGGGGSSDIRRADSKGEFPLKNRILVAGGGGGGTLYAGGGGSGGAAGANGTGDPQKTDGKVATGGRDQKAGTGASYSGGGCRGHDGSPDKGGDAVSCNGEAGGGGGGYFGGGGGTAHSSGAGGSGLQTGSGDYSDGVREGDGLITIAIPVAR